MLVPHQPDAIDFTIATLDEPETIAPEFHIWHASRITWFETIDHLLRHEQFRADTVGLNDRVAAGAAMPDRHDRANRLVENRFGNMADPTS